MWECRDLAPFTFQMDTRGVGVPFNLSPHLVSVPVLVPQFLAEAIEES